MAHKNKGKRVQVNLGNKRSRVEAERKNENRTSLADMCRVLIEEALERREQKKAAQ